jgi:ribosomal-protein-alanine N-acetyltransferase
MARAKEVASAESAGLAAVPMSEHDLLEVVEIEETTGLSLWGWDAYRTELDKPEAIMLVVRGLSGDEPSVVGFIAARTHADEMHVNNIGVRHGYRRKGVGGVLLGAALRAAAKRGVREAILEVRAANVAAQALYARFGFSAVGRRKNYYRDPPEDALVMTMRLGAGA